MSPLVACSTAARAAPPRSGAPVKNRRWRDSGLRASKKRRSAGSSPGRTDRRWTVEPSRRTTSASCAAAGDGWASGMS